MSLAIDNSQATLRPATRRAACPCEQSMNAASTTTTTTTITGTGLVRVFVRG